MGKVLKVLGVIARLLLAVGADKWKQAPGPALRFRAASITPPDKLMAAPVVPTLAMEDRPITMQPGPAVVLSEASDTVVEAVPPAYDWRTSVAKALAQTWRVVAAAAIPAIVAAAADPTFYQGLGLPAAAVTTLVFVFNLIADRMKHNNGNQ